MPAPPRRRPASSPTASTASRASSLRARIASRGIPLDVTIGLRGDFWQALNASVLTVNSAPTTPVANSSAASFDPRIGLKFYVTDEFALRAAAYRNFSAPGHEPDVPQLRQRHGLHRDQSQPAADDEFRPGSRLRLRMARVHPVGHLLQQQPRQLHRLRDGLQHQPGLRRALHRRGRPQPRLHDGAAVPERRQRHLPGHRDHRRLAAASSS